jgi:hypothetical protein
MGADDGRTSTLTPDTARITRILFRVAGRPVVIDHAVVGTISVTTVLIVYDGWASLRLRDVVAIVVGPVLAMFIAHVFARNSGRACGARQITHEERTSRRDRGRTGVPSARHTGDRAASNPECDERPVGRLDARHHLV